MRVSTPLSFNIFFYTRGYNNIIENVVRDRGYSALVFDKRDCVPFSGLITGHRAEKQLGRDHEKRPYGFERRE